MLILHGEDQVQSREQYLQAKTAASKKNLEIINIASDELTLNQLIQLVESKSLFGNTNAIFIEGFFSRRPSNDKKKIAEYLEADPKLEIVLWDGKDVTVQLKNFPPNLVKKFDLPKTVFKFLDTLSLADLQTTLQNTPAELVFALLVGHIRKLIMFQTGKLNLPSWQMGKLKSQANKYSQPKLLQMHQQLLDLDYKQKTSQTGLNLAASLEVWAVSINND